jgi:hypothetical protein
MKTTGNVPRKGKTEKELQSVVASAGSLSRRQSAKEEELVNRTIADYRREKREKRG